MTYKPEQAQLFYAALTGMQNPPLVWQWFCDYDKERRDLAGWEYAYMNPAKLADIQARGCGVFTSVNGSTTGGRGKNDIDIFRAVFMDSDGAPFPDQWLFLHTLSSSATTRTITPTGLSTVTAPLWSG